MRPTSFDIGLHNSSGIPRPEPVLSELRNTIGMLYKYDVESDARNSNGGRLSEFKSKLFKLCVRAELSESSVRYVFITKDNLLVECSNHVM